MCVLWHASLAIAIALLCPHLDGRITSWDIVSRMECLEAAYEFPGGGGL